MSLRMFAALFLSVIISPWGSAPVPAGAQARMPSLVASVEFAGRERVSEETLGKAVKLKPGETFTQAALEEDRKALVALGYFRSVAALQRTAEGKTSITFRVVEWPRVVHIWVIGNTVVDKPSIYGVISTRLGQVLCAPQLQSDVRLIEELYRKKGYVARVSDSLLDEATRSGILRFEILELRIAEVQLEGGTPALRRRLREVLVQMEPQLYQPEVVALDQRRLLELPGIRSAVPTVEPGGPGKVRIRWRLNSAPNASPGQAAS